MDILEFFHKYNYHAPTCCGLCKYHKNTLSYAQWGGYYYCDHPELKDIEPDDKMVTDIGICDAFEPRPKVEDTEYVESICKKK